MRGSARRLRRGAVCVAAGAALALVTTPAWGLTIVDEGVAALETKVDCGGHRGRLAVRTGVHVQFGVDRETDTIVEGRDMISIGFAAEAGNALECSWIQFSWTEVLITVDTPRGREQGRLKDTIRTTGGDVELTTDPANPLWSVDAAGGSPAYEQGGSAYKDSNGTRMFDQPDEIVSRYAGMRLPPGERLLQLEDRKHFEAYLVCHGRVCHVVRWTQRCTWTRPPGAGPPTVRIAYDPAPTARASGNLLPEQRAALDREHPGQTILPPP